MFTSLVAWRFTEQATQISTRILIESLHESAIEWIEQKGLFGSFDQGPDSRFNWLQLYWIRLIENFCEEILTKLYSVRNKNQFSSSASLTNGQSLFRALTKTFI